MDEKTVEQTFKASILAVDFTYIDCELDFRGYTMYLRHKQNGSYVSVIVRGNIVHMNGHLVHPDLVEVMFK